MLVQGMDLGCSRQSQTPSQWHPGSSVQATLPRHGSVWHIHGVSVHMGALRRVSRYARSGGQGIHQKTERVVAKLWVSLPRTTMLCILLSKGIPELMTQFAESICRISTYER